MQQQPEQQTISALPNESLNTVQQQQKKPSPKQKHTKVVPPAYSRRRPRMDTEMKTKQTSARRLLEKEERKTKEDG